MSVVLAIDLGGASLRAALVSDAGEIVARQAHGHVVGQEADPGTWWGALQAAVADLGRKPAEIALCGFTRSQVLVDADGNPRV